MKKRVTSLFVIAAMLFCMVSFPTEAEAASKVASYNYEVTPLLAPFNGYVYVKTNNPDPTSFRLIDRSSKYITASSGDRYGKGIYHLPKVLFADVKYEKESTYRVKGGYIFCNMNGDSDGGQLIVQEATSSNPAGITYENGNITGYSGDMSKGWKNTSIRINCPALKKSTDYLIDTYTKSSMSFFEKMDAVQGALVSLARYPRGLRDPSKRRLGHPYPSLASSPYSELLLNKHFEIYEYSSKRLLLTEVYPFILDSASFPGLMGAVARKLAPNCTINSLDYSHANFEVEYNGETHIYGGAGTGGDVDILLNRVTKDFTFTNAANDLATRGTLASLKKRYIQYSDIADKDNEDLEEQLSSENIAKAVAPGTWARVGIETMFWGSGKTFAYIALGPDGESYYEATDAWVDGRYVDDRERLYLGQKFADHPKADIIVRNVSYKDRYGNSHQSDIVYNYDSETNTWRAPFYYCASWSYPTNIELPKQFILTQAQVAAMKVDRNTNLIPDNGKIFDGSAKPGTPFTNTHVQSISIPKEITIPTRKNVPLPITYTPTNPTDKSFDVEISDSSLFRFSDDENVLHGYKVGTGTITLTTTDGRKKATCKVTVIQSAESIKINGDDYFVDMYYGTTKRLTATVLPKNAYDKTIEWTSDRPSIVSVDSKGNITAKSPGAANITATNPASGTKGNIIVFVNEVSLNNSEITVAVAECTYNGEAQKPKVTVKHGKRTLVEGVDYKVTYYNNIKPFSGSYVAIDGIGAYMGRRTEYFSISEAVQDEPKTDTKPSTKTDTKPSTGTGTKPSGTEVKTTINRIFGKSRYETATKIVDKTKSLSNTKKLDAIIIATGLNYPDALAGSYLAKVKDAPILITSSTEESNTINYIRNNVSKNGTVYILGGTGAVSKNVENKVKASVGKVIRLGGKSRYETNLLILKSGGRLGKELIVVTGMNFPDALSASAAGLPILIVGDSLTREQNDFLKSNKFEVITIIGGPGAVSKRIETALSRFANVRRISGNNRYETSANVASNYFNTAKSVILATGLNYPDALTGGPLAIKQGAPMILTSSNPKDYSYARAYAQKVKAKIFTVLGGPKLVSDKAVLAIAK